MFAGAPPETGGMGGGWPPESTSCAPTAGATRCRPGTLASARCSGPRRRSAKCGPKVGCDGDSRDPSKPGCGAPADRPVRGRPGAWRGDADSGGPGVVRRRSVACRDADRRRGAAGPSTPARQRRADPRSGRDELLVSGDVERVAAAAPRRSSRPRRRPRRGRHVDHARRQPRLVLEATLGQPRLGVHVRRARERPHGCGGSSTTRCIMATPTSSGSTPISPSHRSPVWRRDSPGTAGIAPSTSTSGRCTASSRSRTCSSATSSRWCLGDSISSRSASACVPGSSRRSSAARPPTSGGLW